MILWAICTTCLGLCKTPGQLIAVRFLLGLFEGGLFVRAQLIVPEIAAEAKCIDSLVSISSFLYISQVGHFSLTYFAMAEYVVQGPNLGNVQPSSLLVQLSVGTLQVLSAVG